MLYGSGCVKLLPPEKWYGYPGCRASSVLPAFGHYMRTIFKADDSNSIKIMDERHLDRPDKSKRLQVAFAVREASDLTGKRSIANLIEIEKTITKSQHLLMNIQNVTFEHLDVANTIRIMSKIHIFVSVHGAGMTNMFFMNAGSAVVEIIPHPLCTCRSPDYFYGESGYYHGSAIAQDILHYSYCVPPSATKWHTKPPENPHKCSWKHLHSVESVYIDPIKFAALMRKVERDLIAKGTVKLSRPIIVMNPHANG
jgi:hypothetical protein